MYCAGVLGPAAALLAMLAHSAAVPLSAEEGGSSSPSRRQSNKSTRTSTPVCSLSSEDGTWINGQGIQAPLNSGTVGSAASIALSDEGPFTISFTNSASQDIIGFVWATAGYGGPFIKTNTPPVAFSLAQGASCMVSVASGTAGAWSSIYGKTPNWASTSGYIFNTWGEFNAQETVEGSVVDLSYLPATQGHAQSISVGGQCISDSTQCSFHCTDSSRPSCGGSDSYSLINCNPEQQTNAQYGMYDNNPSGGCGGWSITKQVVATFLD